MHNAKLERKAKCMTTNFKWIPGEAKGPYCDCLLHLGSNSLR